MTADPLIRIALVDDHALFRRGATTVISTQPDMEVIAEADSGEAGVEMARTHRPDVILMDVRMAGIDGIEATRQIVAELGDDAPRIIALTTFDLDEAVARAVEAGASGFVLKAAEPEFLTAAIRTVHAGNQIFAAQAISEIIRSRGSEAPTPPARPAPPAAWESLSDREREIFFLAASGRSNGEIGEAAFVSAGTVKTHISHILQKLGLSTRIQLVVFGYEHGLLPRAED